jgi:hypothetical protein
MEIKNPTSLWVGFEAAVALLKGQQQHVRLEAEQQHAEIARVRITNNNTRYKSDEQGRSEGHLRSGPDRH